MPSASERWQPGRRAPEPKLIDESGQSTVEAAFAIPVLMMLALLLLQPGILLYDRIAMEGAAAEACRLIATSKAPGDVEEDFVRRRLSAVPQTDIFHVHSPACTWQIELEGDEQADEVCVRISTEVRPLPLMDAGMGLMGMTNERGNLVVEVERRMSAKSQWVTASPDGADPKEWVK